MDDIKANYKETFEFLSTTFGAFAHKFVDTSALDVSEEEREAFFE